MGEAAVIWGRLTEAFWLNCQLFGLTLLFALPLGLVVSFGSMSRLAPLRGFLPWEHSIQQIMQTERHKNPILRTSM